MKVRLTKKLAECIDDVPLSDHRVGDVLDLPAPEARLLLAEGWAVQVRTTHHTDRVRRTRGEQRNPAVLNRT
jgi:hypothetical protein